MNRDQDIALELENKATVCCLEWDWRNSRIEMERRNAHARGFISKNVPTGGIAITIDWWIINLDFGHVAFVASTYLSLSRTLLSWKHCLGCLFSRYVFHRLVHRLLGDYDRLRPMRDGDILYSSVTSSSSSSLICKATLLIVRRKL